MGKVRKWTEAKVMEMQAQGLGRGVGQNYRPWLDVSAVNSLGRSRRVHGLKTGRVHELLSDVEYAVFLALEWSRDVVDIREQFPLDREVTQHVARTLGIRHPCYPGTTVPIVMTVDFMATFIRDGVECQEGFDAKRTEEAEDERSLEKLEVQRATLALMGTPHHLVFSGSIPDQKVRNIDWIRDSLVKEGEVEPRPGYFSSLSTRMATELATAPSTNRNLAQACHAFDARHGLEPGTGLRVARMLMQERVLSVDLAAPDIQALPMSEFVVTARPGMLRAVGGA